MSSRALALSVVGLTCSILPSLAAADEPRVAKTFATAPGGSIDAITLDEPALYWGEDKHGARPGGLYRVDIHTNAVTPIFEGTDVSQVLPDGQAIYARVDIARKLVRVAAPGSKPEVVLTVEKLGKAFGVDDGGTFGAIARTPEGFVVPFAAFGKCERGGIAFTPDGFASSRVLVHACAHAVMVQDGWAYYVDRGSVPAHDDVPELDRVMRVALADGKSEVLATGNVMGEPVWAAGDVFFVDRLPERKGIVHWSSTTGALALLTPGAFGRIVSNQIDRVLLVDFDRGVLVEIDRSTGAPTDVVKPQGEITFVSADFYELTWVEKVKGEARVVSTSSGRIEALEDMTFPDIEVPQ